MYWYLQRSGLQDGERRLSSSSCRSNLHWTLGIPCGLEQKYVWLLEIRSSSLTQWGLYSTLRHSLADTGKVFFKDIIIDLIPPPPNLPFLWGWWSPPSPIHFHTVWTSSSSRPFCCSTSHPPSPPQLLLLLLLTFSATLLGPLDYGGVFQLRARKRKEPTHTHTHMNPLASRTHCDTHTITPNSLVWISYESINLSFNYCSYCLVYYLTTATTAKSHYNFRSS